MVGDKVDGEGVEVGIMLPRNKGVGALLIKYLATVGSHMEEMDSGEDKFIQASFLLQYKVFQY